MIIISLSLSCSLDTWTSQVSSSFPVTWYLEPNERQPSLRIPDGPIIRWLTFFLVSCVPASHFVLLQPPHKQQCPAVPAGKLVKDAWSLEIHHYRWPSPTLENSKYSTLSMIMGWSFHLAHYEATHKECFPFHSCHHYWLPISLFSSLCSFRSFPTILQKFVFASVFLHQRTFFIFLHPSTFISSSVFMLSHSGSVSWTQRADQGQTEAGNAREKPSTNFHMRT